jgi:phosphoglycolate phosphatase
VHQPKKKYAKKVVFFLGNSIAKIPKLIQPAEMNDKPWVIFDFDGTLADSAAVVIESFNVLAQEFGYQPIDPADFYLLREQKGLSLLINRAKFKVFRFRYFIQRMRQEVAVREAHIHIFPEILELIKTLNNQAHIAIVTSNTAQTAKIFLERYELSSYFDDIIGNASYFNKQKQLKAYLKTKGIEKDNVIYVADETRDVEVCRKTGIPLISVSWGYDSKSLLMQQQSLIIADSVSELMEQLQQFIDSKL